MSLLQAEGIIKHYRAPGGLFRSRRVQALASVSLAASQGRTTGLVGESGSGKSTLGRILLGMESADAGTVTFDGVEIASLSRRGRRDLRRDVQPVFQDPIGSLDPRWPIGRSVRESLDTFRIGTPADRDRRVLELFDRVGLSPALANRSPVTLSGGQRQRVSIAAALASEPRLIVADEPVSALDVSVQAQVLNLFRDLQADLGLTIVFISHDLGVIDFVSDDLVVLYRGEVIESGSTQAVLVDPKEDYTRALLRAVPGRGSHDEPSATSRM